MTGPSTHSAPPSFSTSVADVTHGIKLGTQRTDPGVAMSDTQYDRIQRRIYVEVGKGAATSIWLALAGACIGFAVTTYITLQTLDPNVVKDRVEGRLEAATLAAFAVAALLLLVHIGKWVRDRRKPHDICEEMDIYCHRTPRQRSRWEALWGFRSPAPNEVPVGKGVADESQNSVTE